MSAQTTESQTTPDADQLLIKKLRQDIEALVATIERIRVIADTEVPPAGRAFIIEAIGENL
ncbi:hypothetical protein [Paeniglutamicibacter terrestris]|uniref:Uncharacterized protein n=1 Tax=Paeniglutamicibacter terrestris TaxID=2723403 RepID=A0ABX1G6U4_9MICC|nr:hypothetical protein [Paeniglutamicibacter terrestris]NKG21137.1 hypothetical protein [Paeniglutamicibacter terrestris]